MSRMTAKGQVTIPKQVRHELALKPGDEVEFYEEKGVFYVRKKIDLDAMKAAFEEYRNLLADSWGDKDVDEIFREMRGRRINEVDFDDDSPPISASSESAVQRS